MTCGKWPFQFNSPLTYSFSSAVNGAVEISYLRTIAVLVVRGTLLFLISWISHTAYDWDDRKWPFLKNYLKLFASQVMV